MSLLSSLVSVTTPLKSFIIGQKNIAPKIAANYNIKLIFYGESEALYNTSPEEFNNSKVDDKYFLVPNIDSLVNILEEKVINKPDNSKMERSNYVVKNFSWDKVVSKLKEEFRNKLK